MPDDTRYKATANSSDQKIKLLEVTIDDCEQSQQTISPILNLEGTGTQCIRVNQKALLSTSEKEVLFPDWMTWLEGEIVTCGDVIKGLCTVMEAASWRRGVIYFGDAIDT